ncbi:unnamed protein product [Moneuplotes crassus]|uniref:RING-type domain-containing protein n=1 Tax=Euplotes crassus TaxID=5936 RepID=A0AAD1XAU5_EUPCR|nr:unnamed protein product [Moneuplotes crassus]
MGHFFNVIHSYGFEISLSVASIVFFCIFPLLRMIANEFEVQQTLLYSILYYYQVVSSIGVVIYAAENIKFDELTERHRRPDGEIQCNPLLFCYSSFFFIGHLNIALVKIIKNPREQCHRKLSCNIIVLTPLVCAFGCILVLTPIYDQRLDASFCLLWLLYLYLYIYISVYGILALYNNKYHLVYFHPFTYIMYIFHLPFYCCFTKTKAAPKQDLNESVSTNYSIEGYDIEGFAEVKPKMDENIFEIYDRLTIHDQLIRAKSFRKTFILKPMAQKTRQLLPDDVPSVESEISRISEESKVELCPVCKESMEENQHIVTSACAHQFHFKCMMNEMRTKRICPVCEEKLRPK